MERTRRIVMILHLGTLTCALACGCASWTDARVEPSELPKASVPHDRVVLEICTIRITSGNPVATEALWNEVDEQQLPITIRKRLRDNGFRCGIVGMQLPAMLREILDAHSSNNEFGQLSSVVTEAEPIVQVDRRPCRPGQRAEIHTSTVRDRMTVLVKKGQNVNGQTLLQSQCVLAVRALPKGSQGTSIVLVPEIHHGPAKQNIFGKNGAWQIQYQRKRISLDDLQITAELPPGSSLLLTCDSTPIGLGLKFFRDELRQEPGARKLILIRLAQTAGDELFVAASSDRM